jgi:hypothetical protein
MDGVSLLPLIDDALTNSDDSPFKVVYRKWMPNFIHLAA